MDSVPKIRYWNDRPVSELSRAELLEVVDFLGDFYAENTSAKAIRAKSLGMAAMIIRGECGPRPSLSTPPETDNEQQ